METADGVSEIYREANSRYIAIKYSVRDLGGAVEEAIQKVGEQVKLPRGCHIDWESEYVAHHQVITLLALQHLRDSAPTHGGLNGILHVRHIDLVTRSLLAISAR